MARPVLTFLNRLRRDHRGVAALEFALVAPVLITVYFGLAEYSQAMMADRKVSHVASSIGDLVAQSDQLATSDITDIFTVGGALVSPFPATGLKMRISQVTVNSSNVAVVDWSQGSNLTALAKGAVVTLPKNTSDSTKPFIGPGESVIMSEAQFNYVSAAQFMIPNGITFKETTYLRPRKSNSIALN